MQDTIGNAVNKEWEYVKTIKFSSLSSQTVVLPSKIEQKKVNPSKKGISKIRLLLCHSHMEVRLIEVKAELIVF